MRLRFSIRDLLWLTLVVGMALGWWISNRILHQQFTSEFNSLRKDLLTVRNQLIIERTRSEANKVMPSFPYGHSRKLTPNLTDIPDVPPEKVVP